MTKEGERIVALETNQCNIMDKIDTIDKKVDVINVKFEALLEKLEQKFVLRTEFKVAAGVLGFLSLIVGITATLVK